MRTLKRATILLAAIGASMPAMAQQADYVYGPAPDWSRFKKLGEEGVFTRLPDPQNWTISWPNGYVAKGWLTRKSKEAVRGYYTCGVLRQKALSDRAPDYFAVVIDYDQVKTIDINTDGKRGLINFVCSSVIKQGVLPPAPATNGADAVPVGPFGFTVRSMPEGCYVASVSSGSIAERAGLKPGMTITSVNGISLAPLASHGLEALQGIAGKATLNVVGGAVFQLDP